MMPRSGLRHRVALTVVALVAAACVISSSTRGKETPRGPVSVASPIKAHLLDGSIVVYTRGATIDRTRIAGDGMRYDPTLQHSVLVTNVPLDSVVGVESYERVVNPFRTLLYSTVATTGTAVFTVAAAVAIFGSCPTIYADSAGTTTLQAESFSYSIAPLLEKRDVDRLQVAADSSGIVRLDVRNEALETHYIDHLELLEARHDPDELIVPAARAGLVAVRGAVPPASIHDRAGRDLHAMLDVGLPVARVVGSDGVTRRDVRDVVLRADERRLETQPGQHFIVEFDTGKSAATEQRTFFIAAQGYYSEWIRGSWLENTDSGKQFAPWKEPLAPLLQRWLVTRDSLEHHFFRQRVPIV